MWERRLGERTGGPNTAALEPPSSSETTVLPDELAASPPGRCYRVASVHRRVTHRAEGGSQPEGPGSSPSRRHALITACFKRPLKSSLPDVTEVSSTGTWEPVCGILCKRHSSVRCPKGEDRRRLGLSHRASTGAEKPAKRNPHFAKRNEAIRRACRKPLEL